MLNFSKILYDDYELLLVAIIVDIDTESGLSLHSKVLPVMLYGVELCKVIVNPGSRFVAFPEQIAFVLAQDQEQIENAQSELFGKGSVGALIKGSVIASASFLKAAGGAGVRTSVVEGGPLRNILDSVSFPEIASECFFETSSIVHFVVHVSLRHIGWR